MDEVTDLYHRVLRGWNDRSGAAFAAPFTDDGEVIGFDGSQHSGRAAIATELQRIFDDHPTPPYVAKVRGVRPVGADAAVLRAVVGMVPPGKTELDPALNAVQTLVAQRRGSAWEVVLLQTTPAQFHGRPELVERLTAELRELLPA
jgi:uncharacterized protein (TIGR02246 family)